jgi:hypothetical protein
MAWQKIPKEHHPLFLAALPDDPRSDTIEMFGGLCARVNGNMASGLWADTVMVRLGASDRGAVLAMKGADVFDPMGRGNPMKDMVLLPKEILRQRATLRKWLAKAIEYTATLPPKKPKGTPKRGAPQRGAPPKGPPTRGAPKRGVPKRAPPRGGAPKK